MYKWKMLSVIQMAYAVIMLSKVVCPWKEKRTTSTYGLFVCSKCSVVRHLKISKYKKQSIYKCTCCPKEFQFECCLKKHLKTNESQELKICQKCSKKFKRMHNFLSHKEKFFTTLDDFVPSLVTKDDIRNHDSVLFLLKLLLDTWLYQTLLLLGNLRSLI